MAPPLKKNIQAIDAALLSTAVHELKTPLLAMKLTIEMLLTGKESLSATQREEAEELAKSTAQLFEMVGDILSMAKLQDVHRSRSRERVDCYQLIEGLRENLTVLMAQKHLTFSWDGDPKNVEPIITHRESLQAIVQNLFTNAVKYNREGGKITVALRNAGAQCIIAVTDTGMGIPKAEQKKIFNRFFRASNVKAVDPYGTGLGLFLTKSLAEQIGGKITFTSTEGHGTTFTIALPRNP